MKKLLVIAILIQSANAFAQEFTGLFEDNYTGSTGMLINPAAPITDPNKWEVNLVSAGVFFDNNYMYYPHQSVPSLISYLSADQKNGENMSFLSPTSLHLNSTGFVQGPSAYFHYKNFCFGIFTDERISASVESKTIPQNLTNIFTEPYDQAIIIPALHAAYINWAELGVNASTMIKEFNKGKLYLGAAIKYIGGLTGAKYANNQSFTFDRHSADSLVSSTPVNMTYSYSQAPTNGGAVSDLLSFNGRGVGADIGVLYIIGDKVSCKELYNWKFGLSVNDIGGVSFHSLTSDYQLTSSGGPVFPDIAFVHALTVKSLNETLSQIVYDDVSASKTGTRFSIWLPASFTLSADKCLGDGFYVDASILRRIAFTYNMVYSGNFESVTPRYESKWFTVAVPLILYNETDFHLGASIRIGFLTIGSDDLLSIVSKGNMAGSDVYVGLRIFPFKSDCKTAKAVRNSDKLKECPPISQ